MEARLRESFEQGSPADAWVIVQETLAFTRKLVIETAEARFLANFGTEVCNHCTGLKTGPGVVSTCFQAKQCYYRHFKAGELTVRQASILEVLSPKG